MKHGVLDVVVIGGGISGVIFLRYAKAKKLHVALLEKSPTLGGKWRDLPQWQDIQIRPEDWSLNGVPIHGAKRAHVLENLFNWVSRYQLYDYVRTGVEVLSTSWTGEHWVVRTKVGEFLARHVVVASGMLNVPHRPSFERHEPKVTEFHSSEFPDPELLRGKRVTVVGGAHSGWDLLDLALRHGAREVHWVYRNARWMFPTSGPKQKRADMRSLALAQFHGGTIDEISRKTEELLDRAYRYFGVEEVRPDGHFHFEKNILVGGRSEMITRFGEIKRYRGVIDSIRGTEVSVQGKTFETDIVLYGTGYHMDLRYLGLPLLQELQGQEELALRCKLRCQSLDYPNLFFVGPTSVESNISTPQYAATIAKTIVAVIRGKAVFPEKVVSHPIVHWDLLRELAAFDRANYPRWWRLKYRFLSWFYWTFPKVQVRV